MKLPLPLKHLALLVLLAGTAHGQPRLSIATTEATLEFVENKGQWDTRVRFAAALPSGRLFAEADGLTFALLNAPGLAHHGHSDGTKTAAKSLAPASDSLISGHAVKLQFLGAAPTARLLSAEATSDRRNYFRGSDPAHWARDVRGFRQLRYAGLWPGIDARVYESADQQLEYDFELAAGADPAAIGLRHDGADAVQLDAAGNLRLQTSVGSITERAPLAWQTDASGQRQPVPCRYQLAADGTVRFALGTYDRQRALTIDPVVVFSTYSGSFADNWGFTSTYDAQGSLYSGGIAFGVGFPASSGAFSTTFAGVTDIAIIKYNTGASGAGARVWATYLGGTSSDFPTSLVVNSRGELLMLGVTSSSDYPTTAGALQRVFRGGTFSHPYDAASVSLPNGADLVITRFNAAGSALVGSTYLGGTANDGLLPLDVSTTAQLAHNYGDPFRGDITVDAADNVYIASHTASANFPVSRGFNSIYRGGATDGLVLQLNPTLTALNWGSFLGGAASDAAYSIQIEPGSGDVFVTGGTLSTNFPTSADSYRPTAAGDVDGFVGRIAANGLSLSRATYLGTSSYDQAYFLQLGSDGGVYILGQTAGAYPTTLGLYTTPNGRQFLHKLRPDLRTTALATVFGSGRSTIDLDPTAFLVDRCDRVYVCGWGGSSNQAGGAVLTYLRLNGTTLGLPITPGAVQPTTDASDFYLAQFSAGLTQLEYATFYGRAGGTGDHVDGGTARFDPRGVVYQAVCSCRSSTGFPIPGGVNTFSTTNNSTNCNNAAFVFNFEPNMANAGTDQMVCATATPQLLVGSPAGGIWTGPGVTGSLATGFYFAPTLGLLGLQTLTYTVASTGLCSSVDSRRVTVSRPEPVTFAPVGTGVFCRGTTAPPLPSVPLVGTPAGGTFSGPGVVNGQFDPERAGTGTHTVNYTYSNGCITVLTQQVRVSLVSAITQQGTLCAPGPPVALSGFPAGGSWTGPGVTGSLATGFVFTPATGLAGANTVTYSLTTTAPNSAASCTASTSLVLTVVPTPIISLTPLPPLCVTNLTRQPLVGSPAGGTWSGPGVGFNGVSYYFQPPGAVGTYQLFYTARNSPCQATAQLNAVVHPVPTVAVAPDTVLCPGSTQPFRLRGNPAGGTWTGAGITGNAATGYQFAPAGLTGTASLVYTVANAACSNTATRRVSVAPVPAGVPTWLPVACPGTRLAPLTLRFQLPVTPAAPYTNLLWEFGDGSQSTEVSPAHTYIAPATYRPRVRIRYNQERCETQVLLPPVEVLERKIPNIFTPNGDGLNETFRLGPDCPPRLQVFSRWGQQVFEAAAYQDEWDAAGLPAGVYYYLLTYFNGSRVKGWVEVAR